MSERYEIVGLIGKGRTGGVYEAVDTVLSRKVALRRFFSEHGNTDSSAWEEPFKNLTGHLCNLSHPSLITVFDAGIDDDGAYMISEHLPHPTLEDRLTKGRLTLEEFWALAVNILEALCIPHSQNCAHSGLATKSIMLQPRNRGDIRYRLVDLGLAWLIPLVNPENPLLSLSDPAIMAPELFEGHIATPATDIYMLGMLFYQALAGGHPLAGLPMNQAHEKHLTHAFAPISGYRTSVPPVISDWIELMTQADPNQRPQSATDCLALMPKKEDISRVYFEAPTNSVPNFQENPDAYYPVAQTYAEPVKPVDVNQSLNYYAQNRASAPVPPIQTLASANSNDHKPVLIAVAVILICFVTLLAIK